MSDRDLRIRVLLSAVDRLVTPLKRSVIGAKGLSKELRETRDRLKSLDQAQKNLQGLRKLRADMQGTEAAAGEAEAKVAALAAQIRSTEQPSRKLQAQFKKAREAARALRLEHQQQGRQLQDLRAKLQAAGQGTDGLAAFERRLRTEVDQTNGSLKTQQDRLAAISRRDSRLQAGRAAAGRVSGLSAGAAGAGATALGGATAIGGPTMLASSKAMSFETAMVGVKKVVNFKNAAEFEAMSDAVLELSSRIPVPAAGLAEIMAQAARSRVAKGELLEFTEAAAKLKVAFDFADEAEAGRTMAAWRNAFGFNQRQVGVLGDQINALTNSYGGVAADVSDIVTRVGPVASVAGAAAGETAALAATLNSMGIESEIAGTGVKNLLLRLSAGSAATRQQRNAFKALGLDAVDLSKAMQKDAGGAIVGVLEKISKLDKASQTGVLAQLFGTESVAPIGALLTQLPQVRQALELVGDAGRYAGSTVKEYASTADTAANDQQLAINNFTALGIVLGQTLLPVLRRTYAFSNRISTGLRNWAKEHPVFAGWIMKLAAGAGIFLAVFGAIALVLAGILAPFAALAFVAGALGIGLGALLGFGALAVVALVAVGVAVVALWKDMVRFWNSLTSLFKPDGWKNIGKALIDGLVVGIKMGIPGLGLVIDGVAKLAEFAFKKKAQINSPSRVFSRLGEHTMTGLAQGIARRRDEPFNRIRDVAAGMAGAFAMGAAPMAAAAAAPTSSGGASYQIHVHAAPGMDEAALARLVAAELDKRERAAAARRRSSYADYG